jgi:hypothetical protein
MSIIAARAKRRKMSGSLVLLDATPNRVNGATQKPSKTGTRRALTRNMDSKYGPSMSNRRKGIDIIAR